MDLFAPLALGLFVVLGVAVLVAWWEHRKRELAIRRRLERAERSRQALQMQGATDLTTHSAPGAAPPPPRASVAGRTADTGAPPAEPPPPATTARLDGPAWAETQPTSGASTEADALHFADTQPFEPALGEPPGPPRQPA